MATEKQENRETQMSNEFHGHNASYDFAVNPSPENNHGKRKRGGKNGQKAKKKIKEAKKEVKKAEKKVEKATKHTQKLKQKIIQLEAKAEYSDELHRLEMELCKVQAERAVYEKLLDQVLSKIPPHTPGLPEHMIEGRFEVTDG